MKEGARHNHNPRKKVENRIAKGNTLTHVPRQSIKKDESKIIYWMLLQTIAISSGASKTYS